MFDKCSNWHYWYKSLRQLLQFVQC